MSGDKLVGSKRAIKRYAKAEAALAARMSKRILPVSPKVKTYVKREIDRNLETMVAVNQVFKRVAVPGAGLDTSNGLGLSTTAGIIPSISRGDGDADRTGDQFIAKKLVLKYNLRARDVSGTSFQPFKQPFLVRVIVYNKRYALDDATQVGIIDKGNTSGNLDAEPDSWMEPYNKKDFIIHYSKTFKMAPYFDQTTNPTQIMNMPTECKAYVFKKTTIKLPRVLLYKDANQQPTNAMPQLAFAVCNIDGTGVTNGQYRVDVSAETQLYYTDA